MPKQNMTWWASGRAAELSLTMIEKLYEDMDKPIAPHIWHEPPQEDEWPAILAHPDTSSQIVVPGASRCGCCGTYLCAKCGCDFWVCACRTVAERVKNEEIAVYPKP